MGLDFFFAILILILSVVIHEVSHGYVAQMFGDPTARLAGRLTLNPVKHLDPIGSFLVPIMSYFIGGFIFGWARPVPYNPHNLQPARLGELLTAAAGALANLLIALVFGLLIRFTVVSGVASAEFINIASLVVFLNIILALFNLVPIPPLDGSKVLFALLPYRFHGVQVFLERYWVIFIVFLFFFLWQFLLAGALFLFSLITGLSFGA